MTDKLLFLPSAAGNYNFLVDEKFE